MQSSGPAVDDASLHSALLGLVVGSGVALRIFGLGAESYWVDEVSMLQLIRGGADAVIADFHDNGKPPVFVWLALGWVEVFGTSETAARSLSVIWGIASIPMMYLVGRELFGRWIGIVSAACLAFAHLQISHAQNFRYYSLMVFLTLVSFFLYYRALRSGKLGYVIGWVAASLLLFYTHYFGVFALSAQTVHALTVRRAHALRLAPWLAAQAIIYATPVILLVIPLLAAVLGQARFPGPIWFDRPPSLAALYLTVREYLFAGTTVRYAALFVLIVCVISWLSLGRARLHSAWANVVSDVRRLAKQRSELSLVLLWLLLPVVLPFLLSFVIRPIFLPRYTIAAAPAFYLLVACVLWGVRRAVPLLPVFAVLGLLIASATYTVRGRPFNEQWREIAEHVHRNARPDDAVMVHPAEFEDAWYWYFRGDLQQCGRGQRFLQPEALMTSLEHCARGRRVWLIYRPERAGFNERFWDLLARPGVEHHSFRAMHLYLVRPTVGM